MQGWGIEKQSSPALEDIYDLRPETIPSESHPLTGTENMRVVGGIFSRGLYRADLGMGGISKGECQPRPSHYLTIIQE